LYHETQVLIRARNDYLKEFRNLGYNFADTNSTDFSPAIVNLTYIKNDYTIMTDDEIIKSSYFDVNVLNIPEIKVENINHPQQIRYKDSGEINFDLSTESPARNLVISMNKRELFRFDSYVGAENIILNFNGKDFYRKVNYSSSRSFAFSFSRLL